MDSNSVFQLRNWFHNLFLSYLSRHRNFILHTTLHFVHEATTLVLHSQVQHLKNKRLISFNNTDVHQEMYHLSWQLITFDSIHAPYAFLLSVHAQSRSRRAVNIALAERSVSFSAFKCFYANCIPPPDPNTVPPATGRPAEFDYWDDATIWNTTVDGYLVNTGGSAGIPQDFDNVKIAFGGCK